MDLGLNGKIALVAAASKGLGKGCAAALVREGVNVVITARGAEALEATAAELRAMRGGELGQSRNRAKPRVQSADDIESEPRRLAQRFDPVRLKRAAHRRDADDQAAHAEFPGLFEA